VLGAEGEALARDYGMPFLEASAKKDIGVSEAFQCIAKLVVDRLVQGRARRRGTRWIKRSRCSCQSGRPSRRKEGLLRQVMRRRQCNWKSNSGAPSLQTFAQEYRRVDFPSFNFLLRGMDLFVLPLQSGN